MSVKLSSEIFYDDKSSNALWHIMLGGQKSTRAKINIADMRMLGCMCGYMRKNKVITRIFEVK